MLRCGEVVAADSTWAARRGSGSRAGPGWPGGGWGDIPSQPAAAWMRATRKQLLGGVRPHVYWAAATGCSLGGLGWMFGNTSTLGNWCKAGAGLQGGCAVSTHGDWARENQGWSCTVLWMVYLWAEGLAGDLQGSLPPWILPSFSSPWWCCEWKLLPAWSVTTRLLKSVLSSCSEKQEKETVWSRWLIACDWMFLEKWAGSLMKATMSIV